MLSETWTTTALLLILSSQNLNPILFSLEDALPKTQIELLILNWDHQVSFNLFKVQTTRNLLTHQAQGNSLKDLIEVIKERAYYKAIILTNPAQSPYTLAYLCYLAGIPLRLGQSQEFAGGVLSTCITPPKDNISLIAYYRHLIQSI